MNLNNTKNTKPFLKWAGGKSQLLNEIEKFYPFYNKTINRYAEPFVGGGAVLFDILSKYKLHEVYISDINKELINTYLVIKNDVDTLINTLTPMQNIFLSLNTEDRKKFYLHNREHFNNLKLKDNKTINIEKAALMIFLNKTCFNGLYRVNKKGQFNVPIGSYKNPLICDSENLKNVSNKLQYTNIICGDFKQSNDFIDKNTFVYFDPPYRPLSSTSNFTSYTESMFNDEKQAELSQFVKNITKKGAKVVVSNSDPKNTDINDNFFEKLYDTLYIKRVSATRAINCKGTSRGKINELIISNFKEIKL
ncbi:MAG: DNA adenine methylase [Anaerotignaceae bacterium]